MTKAGERLIQSVREALDFAEGTADPSGYVVHKPETVDVSAIRRKTGLSQRAFSTAYGVPLDTLRGWEQGKRQPDAPSRAYLKAIERIPNEIKAALATNEAA